MSLSQLQAASGLDDFSEVPYPDLFTVRQPAGPAFAPFQRQRSFNRQSTAFVMRGLWVQLPPLALRTSIRRTGISARPPLPGVLPMVTAVQSDFREIVLS